MRRTSFVWLNALHIVEKYLPRYVGWSVNSINQIYEFTFCKSGTTRAINFNNAVLNNILQKLRIVSISCCGKYGLIRRLSCYAKKLSIKFEQFALLSFIFTLNLEYQPGNVEKLDRIVDAIEAKRNWQWMFPHRFTGMELYWREKCGSTSYLLPLLCRFHRSVVGTSQVEKAAHFFPIFFLTYPSTIMSSFRTQHNFSLAKKRTFNENLIELSCWVVAHANSTTENTSILFSLLSFPRSIYRIVRTENTPVNSIVARCPLIFYRLCYYLLRTLAVS